MATPSPQPGSRRPAHALAAAFALTARSDLLFVPLLVAAELTAMALTALMVLLWSPAFIVIGILLAIVAPLIVLNIRLKKVLADRSGPEGEGL